MGDVISMIRSALNMILLVFNKLLNALTTNFIIDGSATLFGYWIYAYIVIIVIALAYALAGIVNGKEKEK